MKFSRRNQAIGIISLIFFSSLGALFIYNWQEYQRLQEKFEECTDSYCLYISGNVNYEMFIGITSLLNGTFPRVEDAEFQVLNSYGNEYNRTVSGVPLWYLLNQTYLLKEDSLHIRFQASDGYKSLELPIQVLQNFPEMVLVVTHVDGELLDYKEDGGDGPLMAAVNFPSIADNTDVEQIFTNWHQDFVHNSKYNVKNLDSIIVI